MSYTLRRFCYVLPWFSLLAWVLWMDTQNVEGAVLHFLLVVVAVVAAPISFLAIGLFSIVEQYAPDGFGSGIYPESFKGHFIVWWTIMFGLSYWQWFHLFPGVLRVYRQRSRKGDDALPL